MDNNIKIFNNKELVLKAVQEAWVSNKLSQYHMKIIEEIK